MHALSRHADPRNPAPAAAPLRLAVAAIIERDGHFLMVDELVRGRRVLNRPSGRVEPGETLAAAAVRETVEETGWTFIPLAVSGVYLWKRPDGTRTSLRVTLCGTALRHDAARTLDEGIVATGWYSRRALVRRAAELRNPCVMRGIDDYLDGRRWHIAGVQRLDLPGLAGIAQRP